VVNKILKGDLQFYSSNWESVSNESIEFVKALIRVNARKRLTATEALQHPWLDMQFNLSERSPDQNILDSVHDSIVAYGKVSEFKKMALMVIAHQSTTEDIHELRKAFDAYDTGNNGTISFEEFKSAMQNSSNNNYSDEDFEKLFKSVDIGHENQIYYLEFLAATLEAHGRITEERLADAFDRLDSDDSGYISRENFRQILGKEYSEEKVDEFLNEADEDGDGAISFEEFLKFFHKDQKQSLTEYQPASSMSELSAEE
jgi:calcium-dependent protein kinase